MKTKRQKLIELIVARMQSIRVENHYQTDAGALVEKWAARFDEAELTAQPSKCALSVYDMPDEVSKESKHSTGVTHRMRVQVRAFITGGVKDDALRAIIGDIVDAVGKDIMWTDPVTGKYTAMDTEPGSEGFVVMTDAMEIAGGAVEFTVVFATALFDPYQ
jgi:hypothetical protein